MNFSLLTPLLAIGLLLAPAHGDEKKAAAHQLSEWKFGETLFGDDVIPAGLQGRVVVLEYWGAKCSSCLEGMSQLAILDQQYRAKGVRIIGAEAYRSGKEQIGEVVESQKVKFSITDGVTGPISIRGLPHVVVFGADGKLLFSGHPNDQDFEKTVKVAAAKVKELPREIVKSDKSTPEKRRTWTNHEGKPLVASLSRIEGEQVIFKLKDGTEVPYELKNLSKKDQEFIRAKVPTEKVK
ncbi:MAG: thiol-disulfide isomerase/thioredoxin [Akkermansiaceae bacterium]|jgi:thiol-disulfide isomerase/thioredoxin